MCGSSGPRPRARPSSGFGFAVPLLRPFLPMRGASIALMPGAAGGDALAAGMPNVSVLCEETLWPLETGHVDRLVVLHGLETCEQRRRAAGRSLPGAGARGAGAVRGAEPGRALGAVGPHALRLRAALFARPARGAAESARLHPRATTSRSLYQPPSTRRFWCAPARFWERLGRRLPALMAGGVLMVQASKRVPRRPPRHRASGCASRSARSPRSRWRNRCESARIPRPPVPRGHPRAAALTARSPGSPKKRTTQTT